MIAALRGRFPGVVWGLASWLIGENTQRAIYIGTGATALQWSDKRVPAGTLIMGASQGLRITADSVQTEFGADDDTVAVWLKGPLEVL